RSRVRQVRVDAPPGVCSVRGHVGAGHRRGRRGLPSVRLRGLDAPYRLPTRHRRGSPPTMSVRAGPALALDPRRMPPMTPDSLNPGRTALAWLLVPALGLAGLSAWAAASKAQENTAAPAVDFAHDIVPMIKAKCAKCHTDGTYKGKFSLDTREQMLKAADAAVPGKSSASDMVERLTPDEEGSRMPPEGARLSAREVGLFRAWIDQGAKWESGFSFKRPAYVAPLKVRKIEPPPARPGRDHPI